MPASSTTLDFSDLPTTLLATATMVPRPTSTPTPMIELQPYAVAIITVAILVVICLGCLMCTCIALCFWKKRIRRPSAPEHDAINADYSAEFEVRLKVSPDSDSLASHLSSFSADVAGCMEGFLLTPQQWWQIEGTQPIVGRMEEQSTSDQRDRAAAAETVLERLCLIPSGIDQLTIHQRGGTFFLGSGDATLVAEMGTVVKDTVVRYAIILHGPFVYSAGYKPASVVVYLNLEGATLLKPVKLMLNHWCKNPDGEAVLRLLRAPHTAGEMQDCYIFDEVQGVSSSSRSVFTISEPQCLYCVEMEKEAQARYNANAFQLNLLNLVKFKIQLMCDSLEWSDLLTDTLERKGWENNSKGDMVAKFSFVGNQITATPHELRGPGWKAVIHGHQAVRDEDFLQIRGKTKDAIDAEVQNGRYPPCIYYQVIYTSIAERRPAPALWTAELHGADVNLFFSCSVKQELVLHDELKAEQAITVAKPVSQSRGMVLPSEYGTLRLKDLVRCAVPRVASKWDEVGLQLNIEPYVLKNIEADGGDVVTRCKNMFSKWLIGEPETGGLQRTWESVLKAVREAVGSEVCSNVEQIISQVTDGSGPSRPPAKKAKVQGAEAPADGRP